MAVQRYIKAAQDALTELLATQRESIEAAATLVTEAIVEGHTIYSFGCSHSFMLTEEVVYRTGGLMLINPITPHGMDLSVRPMSMTSKIERIEGLGNVLLSHSGAAEGDVLLLASTSGRNAVAIDMAMEAASRGVRVVAITSMAYTQSVSSRHSSGKKLYELADLVVDNCAPAGDAAVEFEGFAQAAGPLSSLTGIAVVNALVCRVIECLLERGMVPPVFVSANLDGGEDHNSRLLAEYRDRIRYQ
jgi:uncharacterized phosphosugar-binding protein